MSISRIIAGLVGLVLLLADSAWSQSSTVIPVGPTTINNYAVTVTNSLTLYVSTNGSSANAGFVTESPFDMATGIKFLSNYNTVVVMPGLYTGNITIPAGSSNFTFKSQYKWKAIIANASSGPNLSFNSTPYCNHGVIDGFVFSNSITSHGVTLTGSSFMYLRNCLAISNWFSGVLGSSISSNNVYEFNLAIGNDVRADNQSHGFYINGKNNIFRYNMAIANHSGYGIQFYPATTGATGTEDNNQIYGNITWGNTNAFGLTVWSSDAGLTLAGTNLVENNTCLDGMSLQFGAILLTNNIILPSQNTPSAPISFGNGATMYANYQCVTNAMPAGAIGANDLVTNFSALGFVNFPGGVYWLTAGSAARGGANPAVFPAIDFFGNSQKGITDFGAMQYNSVLAGEQRVFLSTVPGFDPWIQPSAFSITPTSLQWPGATNNIDLNALQLYYASWTSGSITGLVGKASSGPSQTVTLTWSNLSATNETFTLGPAFLTKDGTRQYPVLPGTDLILSVKYDPNVGHTNTANCSNL